MNCAECPYAVRTEWSKARDALVCTLGWNGRKRVVATFPQNITTPEVEAPAWCEKNRR